MFTRTRLFSAALALGVFTTIGGSALAQQTQNQDKGQTPGAQVPQRPFGRGEGRGFRRGPGMRRAFAPRLMRELNLTDDQRKQVRGFMQQGSESTRAQREELRQLAQKRFQGGELSADDKARAKVLHEQMRASMKDNRSKIDGILTPEQKTRIEELKKERQARRAEFGKRRGGMRRQPGDGVAPQRPVQKP